jgi:hypothetical protein
MVIPKSCKRCAWFQWRYMIMQIGAVLYCNRKYRAQSCEVIAKIICGSNGKLFRAGIAPIKNQLNSVIL